MYYSFSTSQKHFIFLITSLIRPVLSSFVHLKRKWFRGNSCFHVVLIGVIINCLVFPLPCVWASSAKIAEDYHRLAYDSQQNEDYSRALSYYFKALTFDPKNSSYWNDIGLVYEAMGDLDNAQKAYQHALRADAKFLAPYANLAVVHRKKQNLVKAIYYLQKRIELGDPSDPWTQKARSELEEIYSTTPLYRERFLKEETKRLNLQTSQKSRDNFHNQIKVANAEYERGLALLKEKKSREAIKAFNDSLAFAPENPKVIKARLLAQKLNRAQKVETIVQQAMQYLQEGKEQAAKKKFNEVLAIIPNQSD